MTTDASRRRRVLRSATVSVAVAALFATGTGLAYADKDPDKGKADQRVKTAQSEYDETSQALLKADKALRATNAKVKTANATLSTKQAALTRAENKLKTVNAQLKVAQAEETKNKKALGTIEAGRKRTSTLVGGIARQSYMTGGLGTFDLTLQILAGEKDPTATMSMADIVMRQQSGVLSDLAGQKAGRTAAADRLGAASRRVALLKVQANNAVTTAKSARNEATKARNALVSLQKTQRSQKSTLETQKKKDAKELAAAKKDQQRIVKVLRERAAARAAAARKAEMRAPAPKPAAAPDAAPQPARQPTRSGGFLQPPAAPGTIVSEFGMRVNPVTGIYTLHPGVDWALPCGHPVRAAASGQVVESGYNSIFGNYVIIDHGFARGVNVATISEHLQSISTRGGRVSKGQVIGYVGTTGRSTGCHLHWGVMNDGVYINPRTWIG